jgi:hypothetical protein
LRARRSRAEEPLEAYVPEPILSAGAGVDLFAVPFEEIARMVERSPAATRQLASRARRRVHEVVLRGHRPLG